MNAVLRQGERIQPNGTGTQWSGSEEGMKAFLARFDTPDFRADIAERTGEDPEKINIRLNTYFSEMLFGYRLVVEHLANRKLRIMEIGAGLGLLSAYLFKLGHDVTAVEPANVAFGIFDATKAKIWEELGNDAPRLVELPAEKLSEEDVGQFDFIFSVNVMEHIDDLGAATAALLRLLRIGGICVNSCPNYWVPYEPHYGIPMVPFMNGVTRWVFSGRIDPDPDAWRSLNFVNMGTVRRMARENGVSVRFEKQLIYRTFLRLEDDAEFGKRHSTTVIGRLYALLKRSGVLRLTRYIPVSLNTPMVFTYSNDQE